MSSCCVASRLAVGLLTTLCQQRRGAAHADVSTKVIANTRVLSILEPSFALCIVHLTILRMGLPEGNPRAESRHGGFPRGGLLSVACARTGATAPQFLGAWASMQHHALCRKYRECRKVRSLPAVHARPACTARSIALQDLRRSVGVHLAAHHDVLVRRVLGEVMRDAADRRHEHHGRRQALGQDLRVVART
jgi:hypothetical protein